MSRLIAGMALAVLLSLWACTRSSPGDAPLKGVAVIYDESRGNVWGLWDTGFYGYSEFALTAKRLGASVSLNTRPLNRLLAEPAGNNDQTLLILGVAKFARYHKKELQAVTRFVHSGGRLLVIGEHDDMYGIARMQNAVLAPFGLKFRPDAVGNRSRDEYAGTSRLLGIKAAYNLLAASVGILPGAPHPQPLMESGPAGKIIAAETRPGRGHVVALGDSEIFWNGDARAGIRRGENRLFWIRLLRRFFPQQTMRSFAPVRFSSSPAHGEGPIAWFDTGSGGRGPDGSLSGVARFAELLRRSGLRIRAGGTRPDGGHVMRIVVGPLRPLKVSDGERLVLFAEAFDQLEQFSFWDRIHLERGYGNRRSNYSDAERNLGLYFDPCFITRPGGDFQSRPAGRFANMFLHRAGCLRIKEPGRFKTWLRAGKPYHGETLHPGMSDSQRWAEPDDNDFKQPLIAVYNRRALVFSDSDLVSNVHGDKLWFRQLTAGIVNWIRRGSP